MVSYTEVRVTEVNAEFLLRAPDYSAAAAAAAAVELHIATW